MNKGAILRMTITPEMEKQFNGFPYFLEIEMMQGSRRVLKDGRIKYRIEIDDEEKADLMKEFVLKMISKSHLTNKN